MLLSLIGRGVFRAMGNTFLKSRWHIFFIIDPIFFTFYLFCTHMYVCPHGCCGTYVEVTTICGSCFFPLSHGSKGSTQVVRHGDRCLCPLSHLTSPQRLSEMSPIFTSSSHTLVALNWRLTGHPMLSVNEDHTIIKLSGLMNPEYYRASITQPLKYINMLSQNHVSRLDSGLKSLKEESSLKCNQINSALSLIR